MEEWENTKMRVQDIKVTTGILGQPHWAIGMAGLHVGTPQQPSLGSRICNSPHRASLPFQRDELQIRDPPPIHPLPVLHIR